MVQVYLGSFACFGGNDFLGLVNSFLVFFWDFVVEVGFGAVGVCLFDASVDVSWFDSSCFDVVWVHLNLVCVLAGVIFCFDVGLRGLRLVSVHGGGACLL